MKMKFYLVQHANALSKDVNEKRPLSEAGKTEVKVISSYLKRAGVVINKVYHSGKLRAKETAEIFSEYLSDGSFYPLNEINPNDDVKKFSKKLNEDDAMFVGHLPFMEKVVSLLVAKDENAQVLKFQNSGVVCIERDDSEFQILWYIMPKLIC